MYLQGVHIRYCFLLGGCFFLMARNNFPLLHACTDTPWLAFFVFLSVCIIHVCVQTHIYQFAYIIT